MITQELQEYLKRERNLLAFSAGVDSSALFFILQELDIAFDIAIVNYGIREQAKEEIAYAKRLAKRYNKSLFLADAPKFSANFEAKARAFRYNFFEKIIQEHSYTTLLTAHQLDDRLEWLLMRLSLGSGVEGLAGMQEIEEKRGYKLIRPLLVYTKKELLAYLQKKGLRYFIDSSNSNTKFLRNQFRPMAQELLSRGKSGFIKSFALLQEEKALIGSNYQIVFWQKEFALLRVEKRAYLSYAISQMLKKLGYLISGKERESLKSQSSLVVGRKWAVEYREPFAYIAPYLTPLLSKTFKEQCRKKKIPPKVRGYLFQEQFELSKLPAATLCGADQA